MEDLYIAVCGPVDAGKSSLIGVLTKGHLDNGRGLARSKVLHHSHELESGRTSSITINPIKYVPNNNHLDLYSSKSKKKYKLEKIQKLSIQPKDDKIVSFIDLAGHEKYLKTTIFGVTGLFPDRGIVVIGANTGITKLTKEHLGILLYLNIPFIITITKIDLAPPEIYNKLKNKIKKLLMNNSFNKIVQFINNDDETNNYINNINDSHTQRAINDNDIIPVISISNKEGTNITNLHKIIYNIPQRKKWDSINNKSIVYIDSTYNVPGIGIVVSGIIKGEKINVKQKLFIGPYNGQFYQVSIRSIHNSIREEVEYLEPNIHGCFAIKFTNQKETLTKTQIKKGMVMLDNVNNWKDNITNTFTAKIKVLHHSATIKNGYCPVIHCGPIRQSASIKLIENDFLKSQDDAIVQFKFIKNKEFIEKNMKFFFRDGTTKGVGEVMQLLEQQL